MIKLSLWLNGGHFIQRNKIITCEFWILNNVVACKNCHTFIHKEEKIGLHIYWESVPMTSQARCRDYDQEKMPLLEGYMLMQGEGNWGRRSIKFGLFLAAIVPQGIVIIDYDLQLNTTTVFLLLHLPRPPLEQGHDTSILTTTTSHHPAFPLLLPSTYNLNTATKCNTNPT